MQTWIQEGPRTAKIVLIGEAPGANEEREGRPFIGGSGILLDRMLERAGISRSSCFITNVCHVRPPNNDFKYFTKGSKPHPDLVRGLIRLRDDLAEIRPNIVVALGAQPLRWTTGLEPITSWRGSLVSSKLVPGVKTIATYHPAAVLRQYDLKTVVEFDLCRVAEECTFPEINLPHRTIYVATPWHVEQPDYERVPVVFVDSLTRNAIIDEMLRTEWLAVDIETVQDPGGRWQLSCVGFSDRADRALVIPIKATSDMAVVKVLCESSVKKVFQNGMFDCSVLLEHGIKVRNYAWDTMFGHHSLYTECASGADEISTLMKKTRTAALMKGLAFQASIYTREPYYKADGKLWTETGDWPLFWRYNGLDCCVTREIRDRQENELQAFGTMSVLHHELSLAEPLMKATRIGMRVNPNVRKELRDEYQKEIDNLQTFLNQAAGEAINVKSSPQVQRLLYDKLGLPIQHKRGSGRPTADKDAIAALGERHPHPVLGAIIQIRERRDLIERYLDVPLDADGRMRSSADVTGTRTGRLAYRASLNGSGTNLQNQPAAVRRMYIPDDGHIFVYRDYKQAEAQVVAYLAEEKELIDLFADPTRDVHRENAARIFNKRVEDVTFEERYLAKRVIHASNYGMQAKRLAAVINQDFATTGVRISERDAQRLLDLYFLMYPRIREVFWKGVRDELSESRTLTTPFGRKRIFFGRWDDKFLNEAYAYIPQSTVGDMACKAFVRCAVSMPEPVCTLVNVHDSVLLQCPVDMVDQVVVDMEACMRIPVTIKGRELVIPTDCKVGFNWADRGKDGSNPSGLVDWADWLKERADAA